MKSLEPHPTCSVTSWLHGGPGVGSVEVVLLLLGKLPRPRFHWAVSSQTVSAPAPPCLPGQHVPLAQCPVLTPPLECQVRM